MIFAYNKQHVGDVLLVIVENDQGKENTVERKGAIARITTKDSSNVVAWNIFNASEVLGPIEGKGQVDLTDEQVQRLNQAIISVGFADEIVKDEQPYIVTGFVQSCKKHPDSDHLSVTQTQVGNEEVLQIVCGAPNIKAGLKVVVAKPGAMMPDGLLIWPGVLRGVESQGMICSAKELQVQNAPQEKGILELPFDTVVGEAFYKKS